MRKWENNVFIFKFNIFAVSVIHGGRSGINWVNRGRGEE